MVLRYLQRLSGYSRAQVKRLVATWLTGKGQPLVKRYRAPEHAYARRYTDADVALLADVDRTMGTLSGPATACVLRRQRDVFGDPRFERLGSISVGHLYNLRHSAGYQVRRVVLTKTRPTQAVTIGVRRAPAPDGRPGFIRIDSVHQGDWDGAKGVYHINAVDCVTQWQAVATVQTLSEAYLLPVIGQMLAQFSFEILGFHADNGSEYVNHKVARMLDKLRIEFTRSRPRHSNDKAGVECSSCHMPKVKDARTGKTYTSHWQTSPRHYIKETCLTCHSAWTEKQALYAIDSLKNKWTGKMRKAEFWLTRLVEKFEAAQNIGVDAAVLDEARARHAEAHVHWEWWSATNGGHFHNPKQFEESINKGMAVSQAGIKLLDEAMAKRRASPQASMLTPAATPAAAPAPAPK